MVINLIDTISLVGFFLNNLIVIIYNELDIKMNVTEGALPSDWFGHVYLNSPFGTINSKGLPYSVRCHEQGNPIMSGIGYVNRLNLGPEDGPTENCDYAVHVC